MNENLRNRSYKFSVAIIKFLNSLPNRITPYSVLDQLIRAATSIGANIIEAKSASSKKDFLRFYEIALKSSNETKYWLSLLKDTSDIDPKKIEELANEVEEISRMTGASIITMKKTL